MDNQRRKNKSAAKKQKVIKLEVNFQANVNGVTE